MISWILRCTFSHFNESEIRPLLPVDGVLQSPSARPPSWLSCPRLCRRELGPYSDKATHWHFRPQTVLGSYEEGTGVLIFRNTFCGHLLVRPRKYQHPNLQSGIHSLEENSEDLSGILLKNCCITEALGDSNTWSKQNSWALTPGKWLRRGRLWIQRRFKNTWFSSFPFFVSIHTRLIDDKNCMSKSEHFQ